MIYFLVQMAASKSKGLIGNAAYQFYTLTGNWEEGWRDCSTRLAIWRDLQHSTLVLHCLQPRQKDKVGVAMPNKHLLVVVLWIYRLCRKVKRCHVSVTVLWIRITNRIRSDPKLLTGSGYGKNHS
jgi:hypothetical protein